MCIRPPHVRTRSCIPRRSIQVRTPNVYPPATHSYPNLYPAQVATRSGDESVSRAAGARGRDPPHIRTRSCIPRRSIHVRAPKLYPPAPAAPAVPPPRAATSPNVKKPGLRPRAAKPSTSFPLRQRRQRVKFHRFNGYRPRSQPPPPRKERPAARRRARIKYKRGRVPARRVDRRLNVRTL